MTRIILHFTAVLALALVPTVLTQHCEGQSCEIAALSGSSGQPFDPKKAPVGGSDQGDCCILSYNPQYRSLLYKYRPRLRKECKKNATKSLERSIEKSTVNEATTCSDFTLIFAKGTDEPGPIGITVGPALKSGLDLKAPGQWSIQGVEYNNTVQGDYCLGLPGGMVAAKLLESVAQSCPNTKIVMSGYSEGAMVTHNAVAYSTEAARDRVLGVVVFGDPFNGAPIKNYTGPIKTYCAKHDGVCHGKFDISFAHLSYEGRNTTEAVNYMIKLVNE